jgi:hypothetical protein
VGQHIVAVRDALRAIPGVKAVEIERHKKLTIKVIAHVDGRLGSDEKLRQRVNRKVAAAQRAQPRTP